MKYNKHRIINALIYLRRSRRRAENITIGRKIQSDKTTKIKWISLLSSFKECVKRRRMWSLKKQYKN